MRRAQPTLCHRRVRIDRAGKSHLAQVRTENPENNEQIGVLGAGRNSQVRRQRPRDLGVFRERPGNERQSFAHRCKADLRLLCGRLQRKRLIPGVKVELGPHRGGQRPAGFMPLDETVDVEDLQLYFRLLSPIVGFALEVEIEESLLQFTPVIGIKMRPMLQAVALQPLLL